MRFFPTLTEEFTSLLPPAELLRRLQAQVQQARAFTGTVAASSFTISRVAEYRNSMLPRIRGAVAAGPAGGSRLRLHPAVLAFAALWLGGVGSVVAAMGLALAQATFRADQPALTWPDLIPVGMFVLGLLLFTVPFWVEVRQSRPRLIELLLLVPVPPQAGSQLIA
jgi:hypothetical protein